MTGDEQIGPWMDPSYRRGDRRRIPDRRVADLPTPHADRRSGVERRQTPNRRRRRVRSGLDRQVDTAPAVFRVIERWVTRLDTWETRLGLR